MKSSYFPLLYVLLIAIAVWARSHAVCRILENCMHLILKLDWTDYFDVTLTFMIHALVSTKAQ